MISAILYLTNIALRFVAACTGAGIVIQVIEHFSKF